MRLTHQCFIGSILKLTTCTLVLTGLLFQVTNWSQLDEVSGEVEEIEGPNSVLFRSHISKRLQGFKRKTLLNVLSGPREKRQRKTRNAGNETAVPAKHGKVPSKLGERNVTDRCDHLTPPTFYVRSTHPLTAFASYPGSGNSWLRGLLSTSSGINSGNSYYDKYYANVPGYTFRKDDTVIAVKTHHPAFEPYRAHPINRTDPHGNWTRAVILVRHPLDALVSYWNFRLTHGSHLETANLSSQFTPHGKLSTEWSRFVQKQTHHWLRWLTYWLTQFKGPVHILFYESARNDPKTELQRIHQFLGIPDPKPFRLRCATRSTGTSLYKRKSVLDKRSLYTREMVVDAMDVIDRAKKLVKQSYTPDELFKLFPSEYEESATVDKFGSKF